MHILFCSVTYVERLLRTRVHTTFQVVMFTVNFMLLFIPLPTGDGGTVFWRCLSGHPAVNKVCVRL